MSSRRTQRGGTSPANLLLDNRRRAPSSLTTCCSSRRAFLKRTLGGALAAAALRTPEGQAATQARSRIIDIHCHPRWLGHNGARMIENMDAAGIERAWLLSWEAPPGEISPNYHRSVNPAEAGIAFRDVIEVAERYPDRFIPGTTTDPRDPYAHEKLKAAVDIHGVRVFGEFKLRMRYDDPDALRLFHYAGELGLPVIFHLDVTFPRHGIPAERTWWYGGGLEAMEPALKLCPNTRFLGHAPGFWREISGDADSEPEVYPRGKPIVGRGLILDYLDRYPNLYCDLSAGSAHTALSRDLDFTRSFLIDYQDRVLFGRDAFDNKLYDLLTGLDLPDDALARILSGNALELVPV